MKQTDTFSKKVWTIFKRLLAYMFSDYGNDILRYENTFRCYKRVVVGRQAVGSSIRVVDNTLELVVDSKPAVGNRSELAHNTRNLLLYCFDLIYQKTNLRALSNQLM